jgi:hypothetical protein
MFDYYIRPFHKSYKNDSESCHTPTIVSSKTPSRANSTEDADYVPEVKELSYRNLKKAVVKRDGVCLFCWDKLQFQGAHIIAQKNISLAYDESSLFQRAGLTQKHQVQNGLLLCSICHSQFDKLKRYVDFADDKLVVKVVNETNDEGDENFVEIVGAIKANRNFYGIKWNDKRQAMENNGEMALYFLQKIQAISLTEMPWNSTR